MTRTRFLQRLAPLPALALCAACKSEDRTVCATLDRDGGLLQSYDSVLTIALQPEALDESQRFCITPTDAPPEIFGEAYLVDPPLRLNYDAQLSYRGALPDDSGDANIGRISERDFSSGKGMWVSLDDCRVEPEVRAVQCTDVEVSKFYGLLDRFIGEPSDTVADTSGDVPDDTGTDPTLTTSPPETADDTGPQPIDYPPECDTLFRGPYEVISLGNRFTPQNEGGAEDLAPDGHGGFIGRSGGGLLRLDVTGATLGMADDPGFTTSELVESPTFGSRTLGVRFATTGDLILAQLDDGEVRRMATDGTLDTLVDQIGFPNGIYVDGDDVVYFTDFAANSVRRFPLADPGASVEIAQVTQANGVYYDPLRAMAFAVSYANGDLFRIPIADDGTAGTAVLVTTLGGAIDGLNMDVCGNLYAVDNNNGGPNRLLRVFMDDTGEMTEVEEIAGGLEGALANAAWGVGADYGDFQTALFLTGVPGDVYYVDLQINGAPAATPPSAPATVDDGGTDSGGSSTG
jgi:hypothetical protein